MKSTFAFPNWLRLLAKKTLAPVERSIYIKAIQDREDIIRRKKKQISDLFKDRYLLRQEIKKVKDAFQYDYERILHKYGSFDTARAYCEDLEGIPPGLLDWYRDAHERWWNADWWNEEPAAFPKPPIAHKCRACGETWPSEQLQQGLRLTSNAALWNCPACGGICDPIGLVGLVRWPEIIIHEQKEGNEDVP